MKIWSQIFGFAAQAFKTFQTDLGTSPVADAPDDTITFTSENLSITGNSTTDTITINYGKAEVDDGNSSTADTIDWTTGTFHKSTLTGNVTYTFTAPSVATILVLRVVQDSTPRTITWPGTVLWPGNIDPVLSQGSGDVDVFTFYWNGTSYYSLGVQFDLA